MTRNVRIAGALLLGVTLCLVQACSSPDEQPTSQPTDEQPTSQPTGEQPTSQPVAAAGTQEFLVVHRVFLHPRCMNCHPAGDAPLQGDDSHVHAQSVVRGEDGKGRFALKCANCHGPTTLPGENMPPGHPEWHLPPKATPMVFQGKSPAELARQLKDPAQTGGKDLNALLEHVAHDSLVASCWDQGGRAPPPVSQEELARSFRVWLEAGAPVPE